MVDFTDVLSSLVGGGLAGYPSTSGGSPIGMPALPGGGGGGGGGSPIGFAGLASGGSPIGLPALAGFESSPIGLPVANLAAQTLLGRGALFRADQAAKAKAAAAYTPGAQAAAVAAAAARGAPAPGALDALTLSGLGPGQRQEFFQRAMRLGLQLEQETKIPAEVFAAMAANETNFGNAPGNIVGGVKASPTDPNAVWLDTWEMVNGQRVNRREPFLPSATPLAGMRNVAQVLQAGRYAPAYQALASGAIDRDEFLRRVNAAGYATNPNWAQGEIVPLMGEAAGHRAAAQELNAAAQAQATATPAERTGPIQGISQNTYAAQNGLPRDIAAAICGPVAVDAFARTMGRNPGPAEAFNLARDQGLWDLTLGAHGADSMVTLLGRMGVPAKTTAPDAATIAREVQRGHMVIIDAPRHYYQVVGYDPDSGRFQFGDAVGANRWSTLDRLVGWGYGAPRTAIVSTE